MKLVKHTPAEWHRILSRCTPPPDWTREEEEAFRAYWQGEIQKQGGEPQDGTPPSRGGRQ